MKNLFILFLCLSALYVNAQQTISDWKHIKDYNSNPKKFIKSGKNVYFTANDPAHGRELWVTEGTSESTKLVKDIMVGENSSLLVGVVSDYTLATYDYLSNSSTTDNGKLYFTASDNPNEVSKIWETDGTEIGTKILRNEVKGQLHHTGEELTEYTFKQAESQLQIFYQGAKKDTILTLPNPSFSLYNSVRRGNFLFLTGDSYPQRDISKEVIIIDLKKRIITGQISSFYYLINSTFSEIWNNEIYYTKRGPNSQTKKEGSELWRFNVNTGKQDSLLSFTDRGVNMMATPKEFFAFFRYDGTFSINSEGGKPIKEENMNGFYAPYYYQYDLPNDVLYSYHQEESWGGPPKIKGIRLSDKKIVKNLLLESASINQILSPTKIVVRANNKYELFDVKQEKRIPLTNSLEYQTILIDQEKSLTFLSSYSLNDSTRDSELHVFDHKKEEFKLLKNINTDGIKSPKIYTTIFANKLITVYNHEKGIMLSVSDGTKQGTKDLQLLVPRNKNAGLNPVNFIETNERLGIIFQANNGSDSVYCFSLDKKLVECLLVYKKRKTEYTMNPSYFNLTSLQQITKGWYQINAYDSDFAITDLTPKNTVTFKSKNYLVFAQNSYMILERVNVEARERHLIRYNFLTRKYDTLSNSKDYINTKIFEDKFYYRSKITNIWYEVLENGISPILHFGGINKIIKYKNETYFILTGNTDQNKQGIRKSSFYIYHLNGNTPKIVISDSLSTIYGISEYDFMFSDFSIKGKKYLLTGGVLDDISKVRLFNIYDISSAGNLQKVSEFTLKNYKTYFEILKDGIVFRDTSNRQTVMSIMQEDFSIKEIFQLSANENLTRNEYLQPSAKRFYFSTLGNFYVTDGSLEGSKKLASGKPVNLPRYDYSFAIRDQTNLNNDESSFYFSVYPMNLYGVNLWKTDGTEKGTVQLIGESVTKTYSTNYESLVLGVIDNRFIFRKPNLTTDNYEIWTTEGNLETTKVLLDTKGNTFKSPFNNYNLWNTQLKKIGNKLYFNSQTPETGYEPWQTDGTPEGTKMLGDLVKGFQSSDPYQFVEINQNPYCIATETNKALQLWAFCDLKATILAENNLPINSEEVKLISNQNNDWKYQWLWNGSPIEKANLATFKAQYSGTYQVKVEDKIGCTNVSDSIVVKFAQSILANEPFTNEFALKIYPNPTQNDLNLSFEGKNQEHFEVTIYDLLGKIIVNQIVESNGNNIISTKQLNTGMYFLRLSNGEKQIIQKIVKE